MVAVVTEIQTGGVYNTTSLDDAIKVYHHDGKHNMSIAKINFSIQLPDGTKRSITVRQEKDRVVAYGNFDGLESFIEYAE